MHSPWFLAGLLGALALLGSLAARARWQQRRAPIVLEERQLIRRRRASRDGVDWEW